MSHTGVCVFGDFKAFPCEVKQFIRPEAEAILRDFSSV